MSERFLAFMARDKLAPPFTSGKKHLAFWRECLASPTFVYVIQGEASPVKVGFAADVEARMAGLQTGNPSLLRLLYVLPGDQRLEWFLHQRLKGARVRGEWFDGPMIGPFLDYTAELADRMVKAYDGTGVAPSYADLDPHRLREHPSKWDNPITVRYVEPAPKVPREVAKRMRRSVVGCSRSVYLGDADSAMFQPTPGRARNGGYQGGAS